MDKAARSEITEILNAWNGGDANAKDRLLPFVYDELKRRARFFMSRERAGHTLQPTALVHEAFLSLSKASGVDWQDRGHFYGIASRMMRQILIEHARKHAAEKRGGGQIHLSVDDVHLPIEQRSRSMVALDEALEKLSLIDESQAAVVEMRFFGGLSNSEIADALKVSERTVIRLWQAAKFWLYRELDQTR
ncbi:MAG: sigma-70 family RNA polymerase sigma factor [Pyrinomonadaceae bacterium]